MNMSPDQQIEILHKYLFKTIVRELCMGIIPEKYSDDAGPSYKFPADESGYQVPMNISWPQFDHRKTDSWSIYNDRIFMSGTFEGVKFSYKGRSQWDEPKIILEDRNIPSGDRISIVKMSKRIIYWVNIIIEFFLNEEKKYYSK